MKSVNRTIGNVTILGGQHYSVQHYNAITNIITEEDFDVVAIEQDIDRMSRSQIVTVTNENLHFDVYQDSQADCVTASTEASDKGIPVALIDSAYDLEEMGRDPGSTPDELLGKLGVESMDKIMGNHLSKMRKIGMARVGIDGVRERDHRMRRHISWLSEQFDRVLVVCGLSHVLGLVDYPDADPLEPKIFDSSYEIRDELFHQLIDELDELDDEVYED